MAQVAGRAGRKNKRGRVVLQTKSIEHSIIPQVIGNDYEGMVNGQLAERQIFHYPPYYRLVYVYLKNRNETLLDLMAQTMAGKLSAISETGCWGRTNRRWRVCKRCLSVKSW